MIEKNFRTRLGEIDLIMRARLKRLLIFVEVRYRQSNKYGGALESIDFRKQQHIINTAAVYLLRNSRFHQYACRFDVVLISGNLNAPILQWIPNAFECY